jgi:hypothetical protein
MSDRFRDPPVCKMNPIAESKLSNGDAKCTPQSPRRTTHDRKASERIPGPWRAPTRSAGLGSFLYGGG